MNASDMATTRPPSGTCRSRWSGRTAAPTSASRPGHCPSWPRAHLLRDERSQAAVALAGSLELVHEQRWLAFLPWPLALEGELELRAGRIEAAGEQFEHAFALSCQLGDPCWEGMAARGLGLLNASRGDHATAST